MDEADRSENENDDKFEADESKNETMEIDESVQPVLKRFKQE
jgi:hypothetical protein